ncbi:protein-disulfide reductase DsbD family protein [Rufibacter quisquiliarum]|uniref:Thiol:disulfide interchange protein DsbD n=1 Tax=Rufibacter quisquiliarum TaxID=1549639 RepID=A0A839G8P9_9BACT|nr:cytochrome c biogenesis protein CcdA [Rufibacter quisquiliarum]MBA9075372.1 thiol:disulfide interchange protein DsbD [Rufibacter quisquiliarum]
MTIFLRRSWALWLPLWLLSQTVLGQILKPSTWSHDVSASEVKVGEEVDLVFNVKIIPDWYLYSSDFDPDLGPIVTSFSFQKHPSYALVGKIKPVNPKKKYDEMWGGEYTYFTKTAQFRQRIKVLQPTLVVKGTYEYQVCSEVSGQCIPGEGDFNFTQIKVVAGAAPAASPASGTGASPGTGAVQQPALGAATTAAAPAGAGSGRQATNNASAATTDVFPQDSSLLGTGAEGSAQPGVLDSGTAPQTETAPAPAASAPVAAAAVEAAVEENLWEFMLGAFLSGLLALLTPCVFPMVPMTVTFFTGGSSSRSQGIMKALVYGFSIIAVYTLIGTLVAKLAGPEAANFLSTHWFPNILFFAIFLFFAMSFLGMFEITLPHWLVNKADAQADKGGYYGVFFMALTLVLVSFSCTGPIVGSLLVLSAGGETLKPIAGMFAYSLAFALPFTLFAIFPNWLSRLPKSGGWLNSVKVCLGFIELALALKFLSVADQVYHWRLLDREIYLALWIVIFSLMGIYLLGKLKFSHDSDLPYLGVPRLFVAIATFAFVVYLVPGLFGAPLKALAGYLPPQSTLDFDLMANRGAAGTTTASTICEPPKYDEFLDLPHGLQGYFDLEQAKKCAAEQGKPIFIDFTGHGCVNCREMEANVWSHPEVLKRLKENFVIAALYVDDKTELPQSEWYTSTYDGKEKKTLGKKYADYQITRFNVNAQPYYVLLDEHENSLVAPVAYEKDVQKFIRFLDAGVAAYKARQQAQ